MPEQPHAENNAPRGRTRRAIDGLRLAGLRWPALGRTLPMAPQVGAGTFGMRDVLPVPAAAADIIATAVGLLTMIGIDLYLQWAGREAATYLADEPSRMPQQSQQTP